MQIEKFQVKVIMDMEDKNDIERAEFKVQRVLLKPSAKRRKIVTASIFINLLS